MTRCLGTTAMTFAFALFTLLGSTPAPDGRHDFDFEIGTWNMLPSGNTHIVQRLWDGATIARLVVKSTAKVRGSLLSVYLPDSRQWHIYWVSAADGSVSPPLVGSFSNGIGTFVGPDEENGRPILVRLIYSDITPTSFATVQSISHDDGKTWEPGVKTSYVRQSP